MKTKTISRFVGSPSTPITTLAIYAQGGGQFLISDRNCYSSGCYCSNHPTFMEEIGGLRRAVQILRQHRRDYRSYQECLDSYDL